MQFLFFSALLLQLIVIGMSLNQHTSHFAQPFSNRILNTEQPYIEDILDKYTNPLLGLTNLTMLALGSSHWGPPPEALSKVTNDLVSTDLTIGREIHRYGSILGYVPLRESLKDRLISHGFDMTDMDVIITSGANQAFTNIALTLCDQNDETVIISPYYFSHKLSLQLAGANVNVCSFDKNTLLPNWEELEKLISPSPSPSSISASSESSSSQNNAKAAAKVVVLTTPSNPTGVVWTLEDMQRLVSICKRYGTWLVVDQTYYEFLYGDAVHIFPCSRLMDYDRIIHVFSLSKAFGIPGWRVGYIAYPTSTSIVSSSTSISDDDKFETIYQIKTPSPTHSDITTTTTLTTTTPKIASSGASATSTISLTDSFRKIQDTIPTHTTMLSQRLAYYCLEYDEKHKKETITEENSNGISWVKDTISSLNNVREILWPILEPLGTVKTNGAFYFLVPVPIGVGEDESVDILAKQFKVLLMPGSPFGAPRYMRLSYGSIPPAAVVSAVERMKLGFQYLVSLGKSRMEEAGIGIEGEKEVITGGSREKEREGDK